MSFLKNQKVGTRIIMVAAAALIGVLAFAAQLLYKANSELQEAAKFAELADMTPEIANVIHDLQKERGKTEAYLSAETKEDARLFSQELQKLYALSEKDRTALDVTFSSLHQESFSQQFLSKSSAAIDGLDQVSNLRARVRDRSIDQSAAVIEYDAHIRNLLNIIEYVASHSKDSKLTGQFTAYSSLLEIQETMAKERALGAAALQSRTITTSDRQHLAEYKGMQEAYIHMYKNYATPEEKQFFDKTVTNSPTYENIQGLRHLFLDEERELQLFTKASALDWFNAYTTEIELTAKVESYIREDIQALVQELYEAAFNEVVLDIVVTLVQLIITLGLVYVITRSLTGPISNLTQAMQQLAKNNLETKIPDVGQGHELADMAETLSVFKENAEQVQAMEAEQARLKIQAERDKIDAQNKLADNFDMRTADLIASLSSSSDIMQNTAQTMSATSEQTAASSAAVASAATEADANVQTVAAASEELSASSQEIAKQITDVASRASTASKEAEKTSASVNELNELADSIGEVVNAIKEIAEQTNLLALNATIEAARAGDAGKGFAVVADEVKKLAMETGSKTEEIDNRVNQIQDAIRNSVDAMNAIIENVRQIDRATSSAASAVEEQNAATAEIGRNVTEASSGTQQVSENINDVQRAAQETGAASSDVLKAANDLASVSEGLSAEISSFLDEIREDASSTNTQSDIPVKVANDPSGEAMPTRPEEQADDSIVVMAAAE